MILTVSAKRTFDACPRKFEYRYVRELSPTTESEPFERGSLFHEEAEEAHTIGGEKAYAAWVKEHEQFVTEAAEIPFKIPFTKVFGRGPNLDSVEFGGVIDLVARNKVDNNLWLVDHKSSLRFYDYPDLYATEQLFLYWLAYVSVVEGEQPYGVCLSRVKAQEEVNIKHFNNYLVRYMKDSVSSKITLTQIRKWIKDGLDKSADLWYNKHLSANVSATLKEHISANKNITVVLKKTNTHKNNTHTHKSPSLRGGFLSGLNVYANPGSADAPPGYITSSIHFTRNSLVHVERKYYIPTPAQISAVARDFKEFTQNFLGTTYFRRSPGLHCSYCPFKIPCESSRDGGPDLESPSKIPSEASGRPQVEFQGPGGILIPYEVRKASEEVLEALKRKPGLGGVSS